MKLRILSRFLIVLLWLATLVVALCWILWKDAPFDPEPITVVLGLISTAVTALLSEFGSRLEEEEFSLPYALAYGYVNNFVEPLISQLLKNIPLGSPTPRLYIYIPEKLAELEPRNIERVIGRIRMKSFEDKVINLEFQEGRARDVLTVTQHGNKRVYFDFPNTLLSLNSLIDYKMESRKNRFSDSIKEDMAKDYIVKFKQVIEKLIETKDLGDYVFFVDRELKIEFDL
ncbi:MAG: hypothetical protein JNM57_10160 [Cyclobacteriaceae bacterium]|nr:hypothetical protein [Cyclobacteriaceae bacterium]